MNPEFEKRHNQALRLLAILAKHAEESHHLLIFLGGSAVQASLKRPRRLSIDLDLYYAGDAGELLKTLEPAYRVEKRPTQPTDLFDFYKATGQGVLVKIDIARFPLAAKGETPHERRVLEVDGTRFEANVAKPSYLLAAKLVNNAIGATGRKEFDPLAFLKDVSDANALIDDYGAPTDAWRFFKHSNDVQNQIRGTAFSLQQTVSAAKANLFGCVPTLQPTGSITRGAFNSFGEHLLVGGQGIGGPQLSIMAYRLAAYLTAFERAGEQGVTEAITEIEEKAARFKERSLVDKCVGELAERGIPAARLEALRILAPKALIYLNAAFPSNNGPITTNTPGVYNPAYG